MKSVVPVVMAGILGIYGMIVAVIIVQKSNCYFI
jgi:V-type H+-transporting ATPase proteolipid subunit